MIRSEPMDVGSLEYEGADDPGLAAMREVVASLGVRIETLPGQWTQIWRGGRVIARYQRPEQLIAQLLRAGEEEASDMGDDMEHDAKPGGDGRGERGVFRKGGRFFVSMHVPAVKRSMYIGTFDSLDEALAARDSVMAATSAEQVEALRDSFRRYGAGDGSQKGAGAAGSPARPSADLAALIEALDQAAEQLADAEEWHAQSGEALRRACHRMREAARKCRAALIKAYPSLEEDR